MHFFVLFAVLGSCAVSVLTSTITLGGFCPCLVTGKCGDGTKCTPCCGYGKCNLLCENCDGGCRHGPGGFQVYEPLKTSLNSNVGSEYFDIADTNGDGLMTFVEWRNSKARSMSPDETDELLAMHWAKYDIYDKGYLTKAEVLNIKA